MRFFLILSLVVLVSCGDRTPAPIIPQAQFQDETVSVFVVTDRSRNAEGYYGKERSQITSYNKTLVGIPPNHEVGDSPKYNKKPNLNKHFAIAAETEFKSDQEFIRALRAELQTRPSKEREVTLFVHGYYNGYSDSVYRTAQIAKDFENPGVSVAYAWPSAAHPAGYTYDRESVLFARDSMEKTLYLLTQAGARNILVMGHSMGGLLVMEALRQIELTHPGWTNRNIETVLLVSPDIAVDLFHEQLDRIEELPNQFVVFTSQNDKALRFSSTLNAGTNRLGLGNSQDELSDYPIQFVDVSEFSEDSKNTHFVFAESPALIALMTGARQHEGFTEGRSRSVLDKLSDSTLHANQAVVFNLAPDEDPAEQR
ncbi:Esterase/lipase superfamily enzyme [Shimia gijangensis]|uniref:Esterase/lipase superfamily enzyme n=1 Tax=Shimia gijangensis TaxID=1470563 RepID=A0A1M6MT09_9RHOB|nr:Esterase/lipase superfamily enzyme [Shimia gijangensis]